MGLLQRLLGKKKKEDTKLKINSESPTRKSEKSGIEEILLFCCEQIIDAAFYMEDLKIEYELVTSYFCDVQKLEDLPEANKKEIADLALKISKIDKNRQEFMASTAKLPDEKYKNMQNIEKNIKDIKDKLREYATKDFQIKKDMQHLEGERAVIDFEKDTLIEKMQQSKTTIIVVAVLMALTFSSVALFGFLAKEDVLIYCLAILFLFMIAIAVIFYMYKNKEYRLFENEAKYNRLIDIYNKVKIKYVNNTNTLDYIYEKYKVNSLNELESQWEQYLLMTDDIKKFQRSTDDLRVYAEELEKVLYNYGIKDCDVWTRQTAAILDPREMVEVKHNLNIRRQKLRLQLEENEKIKMDNRKQIEDILKDKPQMQEYVENIFRSYNMNW